MADISHISQKKQDKTDDNAKFLDLEKIRKDNIARAERLKKERQLRNDALKEKELKDRK